MRRILIPGLLLLAAAGGAAAQERGGLSLDPEVLAAGGPRGLYQPMRVTLPGFTAQDLQQTPTAAERRQRHANAVSRLRGDGGFLEGFSFGQPLAASRQRLPPPPPPVEPVFAPVFVDQSTLVVDQRRRVRVVNRFEAPVAVTVGDNNLVQQQGAGSGGGPTAQQQVATVGGGPRRARGTNGGGATNLVTAEGNIVQAAPGARPDRPSAPAPARRRR